MQPAMKRKENVESNELTESTNTVETTNNTKKEVEETTKKVNIVPMKDGTTCNFGARANLRTSFDVETNTITFKISTGDIINWVVTEVDNLTNFQKKVYLYGLMERVKSSLAPIKTPKLEEAINKQIEAINKGEFNIRSSSEDTGEVVLTLLQKAYAIVKSTKDTTKAHWVNVDDSKTIEEVLNVWEGFSLKDKNSIRKNVWVGMELARLKLEEAKTKGEEVKEGEEEVEDKLI